MVTKVSVIGRRFGALECISERWYEKRETYTITNVMCRCDCGNTHRYRWSNLISSRSTACKKCGYAKHMTHGASRTSAHNYFLKFRKENKLCDEWQNFKTFNDWKKKNIGDKKLYVRPADPTKPMGPSNFKLEKTATKLKREKYLCYMTMREWASLLGISYQRVSQLVKCYGSIEEVLRNRGQEHLIPEFYHAAQED